METIINELKNAQNVRSNLSKLRQLVRDSKEKELSLEELDHNNWMLPFLSQRMQRQEKMQHFFLENWSAKMPKQLFGKHIRENRRFL